MYELIVTTDVSLVEGIMFFISGMALGFVLGAMLMKATMKAFHQPKPENEDEALKILQELCGDR